MSFKKHAIFPPCNPYDKNGETLLQKFLYTHNPMCSVKQKRTCIKFKFSASCAHAIVNIPAHHIYSFIQHILFDLQELAKFLAQYNYAFHNIVIADIHFLDKTAILINPQKIIHVQSDNENSNISIDISLRALALILHNIIITHPDKPTIPIFTPVQRFIYNHCPNIK